VIRKGKIPKDVMVYISAALLAGVFIFLVFAGRNAIVKTLPVFRGFYTTFGANVPQKWEGLVFDNVKSELKYDSGTMKLFVDGVISNTTEKTKDIPDIKARALGADGSTIQSWWVDAPAPTIDASGSIPFHTEVATPMERTIEDVYLEFISRGEKGNAK
jgi:hypothetical protein